MDPAHEAFTLGDWRVDAAGNRLQRGSEVRPLRHKAMALLVLLARHPGQTVTREQIVEAVWNGNRYVAPKAINTAVWTIRQALGDDPGQPRYLETIAKKGYRLIAPVQGLGPTSAPAVAGPADPTAPPAPTPPVAPATGIRQRMPPRAVITLLLVLALAAALWAWAPRGGPTDPALPRTVAPLTQYPGHEYLGRLSPDGRWLAFGWWQGKGTGAVYLRRTDAPDAAPQPLGAVGDEVNSLAWAPDGRTLAYTATAADGRCTLWLQALADGAAAGARRALAACAPMFTPALDWSPDGRWLAFSAESDGAGGLFLVAPDGSGLRRLTTAAPAALPDHQPAWSPDGRRLAFARHDPADGSRDFHETGLDGQVRRLSELRLHWLHGLAFLPDGQDLVFSTTRQDTRVLERWQREGARVWPLGLDGSAPSVATDGRLVYALMRSHVSIARLAAPGAAPQRLIRSVASDRMPDHHPAAGTVFVSRRSGPPELWLAPAGGGAPRALTQLQGPLADPTWSPRGDAVAFVGACGPGRRTGLCLLEMPVGTVRPLAADAANYGRPAWHPGTGEVWVASDRGGRWQLWRFAVMEPRAEPVATEAPPGRLLRWAPDGSALVYQPRQQDQLRWRAAAGGAERALAALPAGERLLDAHWAGADGLLLLTRGDAERFHHLHLRADRLQLQGEHPLGSFPEQARFTQADDGSLLVEQADVAVADLMQAR